MITILAAAAVAALSLAACRKAPSTTLGAKEKQLVRDTLAGMEGRVELLTFVGKDSPHTDQARAFFGEVAALQGKVTSTILDISEAHAAAVGYGISSVPATVVRKGDEEGLRFYGIPSGYELGVFLETILQLSLNAPAVSAAGAAALADLRVPVNIKVFSSPT